MKRKRERQKLTNRFAKTAEYQGDRDKRGGFLIWDTELKGFALRIQPSGTKSFCVAYWINGRRRWKTIARVGEKTADQARKRAKALLGEAADGKDPKAEESKRATFAEVAADYLADLEHRAEAGKRKGKRSSLQSFTRLLDRHALPKIGHLRAGDVGLDHVEALHRSLRDTPGEANRTLTAISAVLAFAERSGCRPSGSNPCRLVERYQENGERRALTAEELQALGDVLRAHEEAHTVAAAEVLAAIRTAAKTRHSELSGLRWGDVDLDRGRVTLRESKTGQEVRVLGAEAVELLADWKAESSATGDDAPVFPGLVDSAVLAAIRTAALTGFRRSELLGHESKARRSELNGLRWGDVDLERGLVTLRESKTGQQVRVIGRAAVELLSEWKAECSETGDDAPVFPGRVDGEPLVSIDRSRARLWKEAEIEGADFHSLRHSFATQGAELADGRYVGVVGPLLGHGYTKAKTITERYIHENPEAMRPAADAIAGRIARLLEGTAGKVVSIKTRGTA